MPGITKIPPSPRHQPQTWANMEYLLKIADAQGVEKAVTELSAIWDENRLPPIEPRHFDRAAAELRKDLEKAGEQRRRAEFDSLVTRRERPDPSAS